ncbi:MAG: HyaD/HybD family hydrogenase maturation endopeptidase [Anaerolineales bacterium]|jgi:hydrogenase maturation protease
MNQAAKTLVIGVGNLLLSDEGVGIHAAQRLIREFNLPEEILVLDGGTLGLDLLYYLEGIENLLIIDAVLMDKEPGTLIRMVDDEVPSYMSFKMSPHHIGIPDMLFAAKLKGLYPPNVVLLGVQPGVVELGLELSEPVANQLDPLLEKILEELRQWGCVLEPQPV